MVLYAVWGYNGYNMALGMFWYGTVWGYDGYNMALGEIKDPPMGTNQPTNHMGGPFTQENAPQP